MGEGQRKLDLRITELHPSRLAPAAPPDLPAWRLAPQPPDSLGKERSCRSVEGFAVAVVVVYPTLSGGFLCLLADAKGNRTQEAPRWFPQLLA